jgi:hypothetical protein
LRRLDDGIGEVDEVTHESLGGHLQQGIGEPQLLVKLA